MYTLKVSYGDGDIDEPEMAVTEILGTYGSRDEACEAARRKFDAIMERLDDIDIRFREVKESRYDYYFVYGYYDDDIGYVDNEHYYMVSVIER